MCNYFGGPVAILTTNERKERGKREPAKYPFALILIKVAMYPI